MSTTPEKELKKLLKKAPNAYLVCDWFDSTRLFSGPGHFISWRAVFYGSWGKGGSKVYWHGEDDDKKYNCMYFMTHTPLTKPNKDISRLEGTDVTIMTVKHYCKLRGI